MTRVFSGTAETGPGRSPPGTVRVMIIASRLPVLAALAFIAALPACASPAALGLHPVDGVLDSRTQRTCSFEDMAQDLARVRMVFVGESHTNPEHHQIQLRILAAMADRRPHLMVGMEMFERSYQPVLDRWSAGEISEPDFLRESNWYGQWGDWDLYGPILRLARDRHIGVVALNTNRAIIREINRVGLANLPAWMRAQIPAVIDTSVKAHEKSIREIFFSHPGMEAEEERFRRFYEAQCTWDETMAESAVAALAADGRPDAAIVVLAGGMHVKDFFSMPERARRRNGLDYRVVLPWAREEFPKEGFTVGPGRPADYMLFTGPSRDPSSPRLGVDMRGGDTLVKMVAEGSTAAEAGLRPGDLLLSLDDVAVRDTVDIRLALEGRKPGDRVRVRWSREGAAMEGAGTLKEPPPMFGPPAPKKEEPKDAPTKKEEPKGPPPPDAPPKAPPK